MATKSVNVTEATRIAAIHHTAGRLKEAGDIYDQLVAVRPRNASLHYNIALLKQQLRDHTAALENVNRAIELSPQVAEYHNSLGLILRDNNKQEEAAGAFRKAVELDPGYADAHSNLGAILGDLKQFEQAADALRAAIAINPRHLAAHVNLAFAYVRLGQLDPAEEHYRIALEIDPADARAYAGMAMVMSERGQFREAIEMSEKAIERKPDHVNAHVTLATLLLRFGQFERGWKEYEWRLKLKGAVGLLPGFRQPFWDGSAPKGRTILIYQEQGHGDVIQFLRYIPLVADLGFKVVLAVKTPLAPLAKTLRGVFAYMDETTKPPPHFDVHLPLLSLPYIFGTSTQTIPQNVPYMTPDPARVRQWRDVLAADRNFKVGIAWGGSPDNATDRIRSMPLAALAPIGDVPGVSFYNLQKGPPATQLENPPAGLSIIDLPGANDNFSATAAFISNLDLVITVDTSIAHLAGALGKPVWTLLSFVAHWPWLVDEESTRWYPSMRLVRQTSHGDWNTLVARVRSDLASLVESRGDAAPESSSNSIPLAITPGELLDRLSILRIKSQRLTDPAKLENVRADVQLCESLQSHHIPPSSELDRLIAELQVVNEALWDVEDALRESEARRDFGPRFIQLARSVYQTNDRRSALKREIDLLLGVRPGEEKSYPSTASITRSAA